MKPDISVDLIAYEDGEETVICDQRNPNAWIRSDTVVAVADSDREHVSQA